MYLQQMSAWYDAKTHKPVFSKQTVGLISSAIEVTGLVGLDRLFSFMIITNLKKVAGTVLLPKRGDTKMILFQCFWKIRRLKATPNTTSCAT